MWGSCIRQKAEPDRSFWLSIIRRIVKLFPRVLRTEGLLVSPAKDNFKLSGVLEEGAKSCLAIIFQIE